MFLVATVWILWSQSYVPTVPLLQSSIWSGLHWLVPFLTDRSIVFAFPAQIFECLLSPYGDLLEGEAVHRRYFALSQCTPFFLRLLPLFYALCVIDERIIFILPTS